METTLISMQRVEPLFLYMLQSLIVRYKILMKLRQFYLAMSAHPNGHQKELQRFYCKQRWSEYVLFKLQILLVKIFMYMLSKYTVIIIKINCKINLSFLHQSVWCNHLLRIVLRIHKLFEWMVTADTIGISWEITKHFVCSTCQLLCRTWDNIYASFFFSPTDSYLRWYICFISFSAPPILTWDDTFVSFLFQPHRFKLNCNNIRDNPK